MELGSRRAFRLAAAVGLTAATWAVAVPAYAAIIGPCDGSVTIAGVAYGSTNDTLGNPIVGLFELTGQHTGVGGSCEGSVMVRIDGNPLTTPIGAVSTVGLLAGLAGITVAGRGRPPIAAPDAAPTTDAEGTR